MKKITTYEAEDGTIFKDEKSAIDYEERLLHGHWYDIEFAITGTTMLEVCAHTKEEAIKIAREMYNPYDKETWVLDWELGDVIKVYE